MVNKKYNLAYQVDSNEGFGCIVFHNHGMAARRIGANELDAEFESTTVRRAPEFDMYHEQGYVPQKALFEHGWWGECHNCGIRIGNDECDPDEGINPSDFVFYDRSVYCSSRCKKQLDDEKKEQNLKFENFKEKVTSLRPDLNFIKFEGEYPYRTIRASFSFPGGKYNGSVKLGEDGELVWSVTRYDLEAYKKYEAERKSIHGIF